MYLNRLKHCHAVGTLMRSYAKTKLQWDDDKCEEMFVLGCLHDIGYGLNNIKVDHSEALADILDGYKYADEIRHHSFLSDYHSDELDLLYYADASVDYKGDYCTFDERLDDIGSRHGTYSVAYIESAKIQEYLKSKGFSSWRHE